jgi:hypothetical protein
MTYLDQLAIAHRQNNERLAAFSRWLEARRALVEAITNALPPHIHLRVSAITMDDMLEGRWGELFWGQLRQPNGNRQTTVNMADFRELAVELGITLTLAEPTASYAGETSGSTLKNRCPACGSTNLKDKGSFEKCMDCGQRLGELSL